MLYIKNKRFSLMLVLWISTTGYSQQMVSHPLSSFGIGEYHLHAHGIYAALGESAIAGIDSAQLNYFNPASYANLSPGITLFSVGINQRVSQFKQNDQQYFKPNGNLNHLALGFRIKNNMGLCFGIKPFSAKGYYLSERMFTGVDSLLNTYEGNGYINEPFLGFSFAPIHTKHSYLGLGVNGSFLFGYVDNTRTSKLIQGTSNSGGISVNTLRLNAPKVEFGAAFTQDLGPRYHIKLGLSYTPGLSYRGNLEETFYSATNLSNVQQWDTLFTTSSDGKVIQASVWSLGAVQHFRLKDAVRKNKTLHPDLMLHINYSRSGSMGYSFPGTSLAAVGVNALASYRFGAGVQYSPERKMYENVATLGFLDKFHYRAGFYFGNLPYQDAAGNGFQERAITLGLGIPILVQQSLSSVNVSVVLGERGTGIQNGLQEQFVSIQLGTILSPSVFERWFRKRKMD
ncbi:MAG: hypothetical protein ACO28O_02555 [Crocinitomicaceae bacterium]